MSLFTFRFTATLLLFAVFSVASSKLLMLTYSFPPMSQCDPTKSVTVGKSADLFSGIEIDIFNAAAKAAGWKDSDWDYKCVTWDFIMDDTQWSDSKQYLGAIGGITITYQRYLTGHNFSIPTFNTGLTIVLQNTLDSWIFITLIEWRLGMLLIFTPLICSFLYFFLEKSEFITGQKKEKKKPKKRKPDAENNRPVIEEPEDREEAYEDYLWHSYASVFFVNGVPLKRTSSRVIQVAFWFMMLIFFATYVANMTAVTSVATILNGINGPNDLNQRKVTTYNAYFDKLYPYGAKPVGAPNDTIEFNQFDDILGAGDISAIVCDDVQARTVYSMSCDISLVTPLFEPMNYGILYQSTQTATIINQINTGLHTSLTNSSSNFQVANYLAKNTATYPPCVREANPDANKIGVDNVKGLWIILAVVAGIAFIIWVPTKIPGYKSKVQWMIDYRIFKDWDEEEKEEKKGDDLIEDNLKKVIGEVFREVEKELEERLQNLENRVSQFYDLLLAENGSVEEHSSSNADSNKKNAKMTPLEIEEKAKEKKNQ